MDRVFNWNVALGELARELVGQAVVWGETDCVSVARKALVAMYGEDISAPYIDVTYSTKLGAARALKKIGGLETVIDATGCRGVPLHLTRDGDFLFFESDDGGENIATKMGSRWVVAIPEENTIRAIKLNIAELDTEHTRAYRV